MDGAKIYGKSISFPPRLGANGRWAFSVGPDNIRESLRVILLTEPGERIMLSEFGARLSSYLFEPNTVATRRLIQDEIQQALQVWEARISIDSVTVAADDTDPRAAVATIQYKLVASQAAQQVSVVVQLAG